MTWLLRTWPAWLAVLTLGACETGFDPILPSDLVYSMSGYLDTEADTNWIRIEPVSETFVGDERPLDVAVVLQGPGGEVPFVQSVERFQTGPAHLFRVVADLEPGVTYTVVAAGADGRTTRARVRMPPATDPPVLADGPTQCPTTYTIQGAEAVGDAFVIYRFTGAEPRTTRFSRRRQLVRRDGEIQATSFYGSDALEMNRDPLDVGDPELSAEITLAVVTTDWPEAVDLETELTPVPNPLIENGIGFVGGASVWRTPFQPGALVFPFIPPAGCYEFGRGPR